MNPQAKTQRKDAILLAASDHFGRFGFRGASLRDIARDAGVSLTLLNHHFGCKSALLSAVVAAHRPMLQERVAVLRRLTNAGSGGFTPRDLVRAWIGIGFETAALPEGLQFLRLLARVIDDPSEDGVESLRDPLDEAALVFIDALQQCCPGASRHAAASACLCVSAALSKLLVSGGRLARIAGAGQPRSADAEQAWLERFLVAGIDAALGTPEVDADAKTALANGRTETPRWVVTRDLAQAAS